MDVPGLIIGHLDAWWVTYRRRLEGLTDEEHLWTPVPGWSVRDTESGWIADIGDRAAQPAPFTSIAWRMWHIATDCLDSYSGRAFGTQSGPDDLVWYGTASEALTRTDAAWACFRDHMAALDDEALARPLGSAFGGFATATYAHLALHAHAEVVHHGAEIAVLRDLYAAR